MTITDYTGRKTAQELAGELQHREAMLKDHEPWKRKAKRQARSYDPIYGLILPTIAYRDTTLDKRSPQDREGNRVSKRERKFREGKG